jgi:hypothetical protein
MTMTTRKAMPMPANLRWPPCSNVLGAASSRPTASTLLSPPRATTPIHANIPLSPLRNPPRLLEVVVALMDAAYHCTIVYNTAVVHLPTH